MNALRYLIWRNTKLFFKDRGMFFTALVTPLILLLLFVTFLGDIYRDSFRSAIPAGLIVPESLVEGFAGGWLFSSLLAVCCVTVAFCANMLMVQDKATGTRADLCITPVKKSMLALGYYTATALSTLVICGAALGACFLYLGGMGWYLSAADVLLTCLDVFLLVMFGTADFSGRHDCQRLLRLPLRGLHADFPILGGHSDFHLLPARYLWHGSFAPSSHARRAWRAGGFVYSAAGSGGYSGRFRL